MDLIYGAQQIDRVLPDAETLLAGYLTDDGTRYLNYQPVSGPDQLVPDDLAVTILINSRAASKAFKSVQDRAGELDLAALPHVALEDTDERDRQKVAEAINIVAWWPGFGSSIATKVLHKKRPALIPILDNQAIYGAYMNPMWPSQRSRTETVKGLTRIRTALDWIHTDLIRSENRDTWAALQRMEPKRSRIQLFDMVWWTYFRHVEPVRR